MQGDTDIENKVIVSKGERGEHTLGICAKQTHTTTNKINKDPLYSTGNYTQGLVITHSGKEYEKEYMCN